MTMNATAAVRRLQRAAAENSRVTRMVFQAARVIQDYVLGMVPGHMQAEPADCWDRPSSYPILPRGYAAVVGNEHVMYMLARLDQANGSWYWRGVDESREDVLAFARDVANGWLDELAAFLESDSASAANALQTLQEAVSPTA